jgi:hypothetical protein
MARASCNRLPLQHIFRGMFGPFPLQQRLCGQLSRAGTEQSFCPETNSALG